ncbi:MAG: nucleotide sugar dehydrogenase [bacterium]
MKGEEKPKTVGVVGLGYVGLPLLLAFREAGGRVIGVDVDGEKIRMLRDRVSYLSHIPDERLGVLGAGNTRLEEDFSILGEADAVVIAVPTPLKGLVDGSRPGEPDLSYVETTAEEVAPHLRRGMLVSLESTTYPGTTREVVAPRLEAGSGLEAGTDFFLAYSPERVDPGSDRDISAIPKIVAGLDEASLEAATRLYGTITPQVVPVSSLEAAEMAKLLENIYRAVNIAMVNELKLLAHRMDVDIWEVVEAAATKPFGFQPFYPGPGLGGHCLPIDPFYLAWRARERFGFRTRFIELAGRVNAGMPGYVLERTREALGEEGIRIEEARVLLLGVAYKRDVGDTRESPGLRLMYLFEEAGAQVGYHDPYVPRLPETRDYPGFAGRTSVGLDPETLGSADAVIIATDHTGVDYARIGRESSLVVDTRNAMSRAPEGRARVVRA